jgi:TPR repeat protein
MQDRETAMKRMKSAADRGFVPAMLRAGDWLKHNGGDCEPYYRMAAEAGDAEGQYKYGKVLEPRDPAQAFLFFGKSSAQEYPDGMYAVAIYYCHARQCNRAYPAAVSLLEKAILKGHVGKVN